jgi:hypothetical protein
MPSKNTYTYIGILFQCMMFDVELKRGDNSIKRHLMEIDRYIILVCQVQN